MKTVSDQEATAPDTPEEGHVNKVARRRVLAVCLIASLAGLMCGLDIGVISGVLKPFGTQFHVSTGLLEWVVGGMLVGATIGALTGGTLCNHLGRKYTLTIAAFLFAVGAFGSAASWSVASMIACRVLVGLGMGLSDFTTPQYLSEIARKEQRGAMVSTYQLLKTIGIFLAFFSNSWLSPSGAWRTMLIVEAIPAVLFLGAFLFLPQSPRWLVMRGHWEHAFEVMTNLRDTSSSAQRELEAIDEQLQTKQEGWKLLRRNSNFRRSVGLGMLLQIMQQFAGINIIMYYAPRILEAAHFDLTAQMWCTALIGLVNVLMTFVAIGYSDRWGRKPILYMGYASMALSMAILAVILYVGPSSLALQLSALALIIVFVGGFAMSAGPLMWVICSEIQPNAGRNLGISISTGTNMLSNLFIGTTFLTMLEGLGSSNTFWVFASFNALAIILIYLFVPETKDVSLETIEKRLMSGVKLRQLGK
ncbi:MULTISPECIES: sugar porter family MFS transporter [unclassified Saccharibacter]|uniref:sugar porter family MFS transporter n=1 Tax=unclassified Saccharibacter TaxID=2648722 RepID=UPI0013218B38|nr:MULTISPECIES: sugar porter family MFS transporter [unclassified Saccharibacter]MXV36672.1 sugar porter family MFS transporter [Saccharibacter sp. EH611]MXV58768.1 sugar porter family MFS transporter [Saccharibacter sp. EH70]MXV65620.1 sugar porter family MFS transporter [Saccharibacter sp. EH60]